MSLSVQVDFAIAMNNQMQLAHNLRTIPAPGGNHCGSAACGNRANECVNLAGGAGTVSGDYLFIEGAFSMNAAAPPTGNRKYHYIF